MASCAEGYVTCLNKPSGIPSAFVPLVEIPDSFCCQSDTECEWLAENTTLLCCPSGGDCNLIAPISCDLTLQNSANNPEALIKTLLLAGSLPECEEKCCPWGYGCDSAQNCGIGLNDTAVRAAISLEASRTGTEITPSGTPTQSAKASATAPTGITTPILSSDVPARSSSTSALTSNSSAAEASSPVTAETKAMIAAAVLGGLLAILLVMASIFILRRKHGRKLKTKRASQRQFMKAELDADGELRPRHAFHMLSSDRGPAELPATPLKSHMATPVCAELEARDAAGEGKSWRRETCRVHKGT